MGNDPGFAPNQPTDGREEGHWKTRYDRDANKKILIESIYLGFLLVIWIVLIGISFYKYSIIYKSDQTFTRLLLAWIGGSLGGTLYSIKWLYHSVAKNIWNIDRRLWRIFTPHISGALGLVFIFLLYQDSISNNEFIADLTKFKAVSIGFLVGYFSDNALGKLSEVANAFFGGTIQKNKVDDKN